MPIESGALDSIIGEGLAKSPYQLAIEKIEELEKENKLLKSNIETILYNANRGIDNALD